MQKSLRQGWAAPSAVFVERCAGGCPPTRELVSLISSILPQPLHRALLAPGRGSKTQQAARETLSRNSGHVCGHFQSTFYCNVSMLFLCDMRVQSGEASCLERGELALTFHDFKEVGGKENLENHPASLVGWTEIYTKNFATLLARDGVRVEPGCHCGYL